MTRPLNDPPRMGEGSDTAQLLSELARVKVLFQLRAVATVMDLPPPSFCVRDRA
jgi:hypothetical protein